MPDGSANAFLVKPGIRVNTPAFVAFAGPSGSGKTRSALELATGLAGDGKILVADTEGNRALHYADLYGFDHVEWRPPFTPERNAELIELAERGGYAVLIIDSESDEYEGEGGLQEIRVASNDEFWAKTKARHKHALVNRMRRAKVHIIFCLRAEERVRISKVDNRTVVEPLGWQPICEKRFLYEVQSSFLFSPTTPGVPQPIKLYDIHARFFPREQQVNREAGELLAQWCAGGVPAPAYQPTIEERARAAAEHGVAELNALWRSLTGAEKDEIADLIGRGKGQDFVAGELTLLARSVDERRDEPPDEIPFGDAAPSQHPSADARPERDAAGADLGGPDAGAPEPLPDNNPIIIGENPPDTSEAPDPAWLRAIAELAPQPVDLASDEPNWKGYADALVKACGKASLATRGALETAKLPHLQKLRTEDGDSFRRVMAALAAKS